MATWIICFLIPLCSLFTFNLVGTMRGGELLIPLLFYFNSKRCLYALKNPVVIRVIYLLILYFIAQIFSDLWRGTNVQDSLRGWAKILLFGFSYLSFMGALWGKLDKAMAFIYGMLAAYLINLLLNGLPPLSPDSFKWIYGSGFALIIFIFVGSLWTRHPVSAGMLLLFVIIFSFLMNFRSLAGISIMASAILYWSSLISGRYERMHGGYLVLAVIAASLMISVSVKSYSYLAAGGYLGEPAKEKYRMQVSSPEEGFSLLDSRNEAFFAMPKIIESPFIGWGSWAKDLSYVRIKSNELSQINKGYIGKSADEEGLIPAHSHILSGALEAGLLGGFFWLFVAWLCIRNAIFLNMIKENRTLWSVLVFITVLTVWDILFSPFAGSRRVDMGFFVCVQTLIAIELGYERIFQVARTRRFAIE